ncbi:hypothetical protein A2482_04045 [Candidatus Falkowbacteria bacterium RIFOXYC2_FULL_48_21]|uniref:Uncharacterized protein n=1 Tax=Candidatus Falkowbacteria bacterium RIFOXYC2_FULL_48_21 TaxID=1798005 RepID=A0A1F5T8Z2_9BACT|nr:MAG: hypothetical protein A2482_04045 [Candidatus Falkowbacteria bacterium RIFOXYC2_FULL_48_21]
MKKTLSPEKQKFLAWLDAHRDGLRQRLTLLTPPELRRFARKIIADLAFDGCATKTASGFKNPKKSFTKFRHTVKLLRQLRRAWLGVVSIRKHVQCAGPEYRCIVAIFKLK